MKILLRRLAKVLARDHTSRNWLYQFKMPSPFTSNVQVYSERPTGFLWKISAKNAEEGSDVYGRQVDLNITKRTNAKKQHRLGNVLLQQMHQKVPDSGTWGTSSAPAPQVCAIKPWLKTLPSLSGEDCDMQATKDNAASGCGRGWKDCN